MNRKHIIVKGILLVGASVALLTGCSEKETVQPTVVAEAISSEQKMAAEETTTTVTETTAGEHIHTGVDGWDRDPKDHWQVCECGEILEHGAHELEDEIHCTICGSEVWIFEDGGANIMNHTEEGRFARSTTYDADGNIENDLVMKQEYDEAGNLVKEFEYQDGRLASESIFGINIDGMAYASKCTTYWEEGGYVINEYNEYNDLIAMYSYAADDTLEHDGFFEYADHPYGGRYEIKAKETDYLNGISWECEYNEYEDCISRVLTDADGNVTVSQTHEYSYAEDGLLLDYKTWEFGNLSEEYYYEFTQTEDYDINYVKTHVKHFDDGTKCVTEMDCDGMELVKTYYGKDGSVDYVLSFEYVMDMEGTVREKRIYKDGSVAYEHFYEVTDDGLIYEKKLVEYLDDGTVVTTEYDEMGNVIPA